MTLNPRFFISIIILVVFFFSVFIFIKLNSYPENWKSVEVGMNYQEVCEVLSIADPYSPDSPVYGAFLEKDILSLRKNYGLFLYKLEISFNGESAEPKIESSKVSASKMSSQVSF